MPAKSWLDDKDEVREFVATMQRHENSDGTLNISAIARDAGLTRSSVRGRVKTLTDMQAGNTVEMPAFVIEGDPQTPIDEIRKRMRENFERKKSIADSRNWFEIKLKENRPYGLLWFGDPHLDDDGCNWPLVEKHVAIAQHDGIYGCNIGDTTNRWVGRLMAKYASQETSMETADRLAEWFMLDSGVNWLVWLLGNHDLWQNGSAMYKRMGAQRVPVIDWRAKFRIVHPNGSALRVDAAHGRKGTSIYNELHGTLREAVMGEVADLYVTGHTHNYAMEHLEVASKDHVCWLAQLRGYKHFDEYALVKGFPEYRHGAAVLAIVDPGATDGNPIIQMFEDVEVGADYLKWLRAR